MLRMLRVIGIIVFALIVGYSANSLYTMYESRRLFEPYNSQRKADITLFAVSITALLSLGSYEVRRLGNSSRDRRYGERRYTDEMIRESESGNVSNIYSTPETRDEWQGKRRSSSRSHKFKYRPARDLPAIWMGLLQIICIVLPLIYAGIFSVLYGQGLGNTLGMWLFSTLSSVFILIPIISAIGIFQKKTWGLSLGYLLAVLNLIVFPIGTAIGLLLLIALVGASSVFSAEPKPRSRTRGSI